MIYAAFRFLRLHVYKIVIEYLKLLNHLNGMGVTIPPDIKIAVISFFVCVGIPHKVAIYAN
jgi:hypothetical protein